MMDALRTDSLDHLGVLHPPSGLSFHLDHVEVDIVSVQISDGQNGIDGDFGHLAAVDVDDLTVECGHGGFHEGLRVVHGKLDLVPNLVQALNGHGAGALVPLRDADGVDAAVEQLLGVREEGSGEDNHASGPVTDLIVL